VNARIQVEHPITEMVTGVDLVRQQILIASGEKLQLSQDRINQNGHAIETRIYAEDPDNNFVPSPGKIHYLSEPQGPGIRIDSGIFQGWNVPPHYDPILSKLIIWSENRKMSIVRISETLKEYVILGIKTNIGYLSRIIKNDNFIEGNFDTHFIDNNEEILLPQHNNLDFALIASALNKKYGLKKRPVSQLTQYSQKTTPWQELGNWEICGQ